MPGTVEGTIALVTGAARGIGRAACDALREGGSTVIATGRASTPPGGRPEGVEWLDLDVTDEANWARVMEEVDRRYGRLDILVNNAGVNIAERFEDMSYASWRNTMSINLDGVFLGIRTALPLLRKAGPLRRGGASVVNLSSIAGIVASAFIAPYCASKGAIKLLTKALALEFSALGYPIRVNSVNPGAVETGMADTLFQTYIDIGIIESAETAHAQSIQLHPIGRLADPSEIAAGIRFLASDEASFMHGTELVIDGGYTAR